MSWTSFGASLSGALYVRFACPRSPCDGVVNATDSEGHKHGADYSGICPVCRHRCNVYAAAVSGSYYDEPERGT